MYAFLGGNRLVVGCLCLYRGTISHRVGPSVVV